MYKVSGRDAFNYQNWNAIRDKKFDVPWRVRSTYRSLMYKGGMKRRAIGNMMASKKGTDNSESVIQGMLNVPIVVDTTSSANYSSGEVVAIPIWQLLFNSEYWPKMKDLWEQVKITGVRCKLLGNSAASTVLASGLSSVGVLVAMDRNGVDGVLAAPAFQDDDLAGTKRGAYIMYLNGSPATNVNKALAYGSCKTKNWSPGNAFYQWVSCYPSSMSEKDPWLNCDDGLANIGIKGATGSGTDTTYELGYPNGLTLISQNKYNGVNGAYKSFGFDPVLLIGVYNIPMVSSSSQLRQTFTFSLEFKIATCWRGPRGQKTDIYNNIKLDPPEETPRAITLNYTANTPEGGDVQEGLFNKVTVNVNVPTTAPPSEEIPTELNLNFTSNTPAEGETHEGLYNKVNVKVNVPDVVKTAYWVGYGTASEKVDIVRNARKNNSEGSIIVEIEDNNWIVEMTELNVGNGPGKWRLRYFVNDSGTSQDFNVGGNAQYIIKSFEGAATNLSFYEDEADQFEDALLTLSNDVGAGEKIWVSKRCFNIVL